MEKSEIVYVEHKHEGRTLFLRLKYGNVVIHSRNAQNSCFLTVLCIAGRIMAVRLFASLQMLVKYVKKLF